ncbi:FAD-dependent oxidoreductase [Streptomyces sp. ISL-100]|uniref:FAD-dependent oxidoreductase n=1 Tax=Streptomyces sp. ISL-100 TaxID=2819173 RepID=UPI001BE902A6|nr:FAD-dependent oxidoreductase [Streptomyces sp. ISL-100]MBT2398452.1 NAD(P)/FAD-dependent oxidoreductase [Streptomyces sp. ISL-100]
MRPHITVIGGGVAGLTAAITAAESGAKVTLYEAHHTLGGRARTAEGPYKTNEGPHALYNGGPLWAWLKQRDLLGPVMAVPPLEGARFRFHRGGALRRTPPLALVKLGLRSTAKAPVNADFLTWATGEVGEAGARAAATYMAVALFHHDPGSLSAPFVQERLRRVVKLPPEAHYPRGGWASVVDRMAAKAWNLGVRIETTERVTALPENGGPVIVATSLEAARRLLGDDATLTWDSGRTVLFDLAVRTRRGDPFVISDLEAPGWIERFAAQDPTLAPAGEQLVQSQFPIGPGESKADGIARAERLLDLGFPGWRERVTWRREAVAAGRTGALDRPGTTWRDRPAINRGNGVYLAGDQVAAPGLLAEVAFNSGLEAATLALRARKITGREGREGLDLNRA